jgi:coenzyme PQQ precursor peptide PqqA
LPVARNGPKRVISFQHGQALSSTGRDKNNKQRRQQGSETMRKWKTPKVIEIAVGMEINCYACATL